MTRKISEDVPTVSIETHDFATASKGEEVFVLVVDKESEEIVLSIPAMEFEYVVKFYFEQVYGSYIEKEITLQ